MAGRIRATLNLERVSLRLSIVLAFVFACCSQVVAEDPAQTSSISAQAAAQNASSITAVPNRPTFSTTAETVQRGVFEIEYGYEAASGHQNINGLLKLGFSKNLELRFAHNPLERDAGTAALGDCAAGLKYRFVEERGALPTVSVLYTATLPTAGGRLGAGALGHAVGVLLSKDFGRHHVDFNESAEWRGRTDSGGFDRDYFTALAYSHPLTNRAGITAEIAGFSRVNASISSTLTVLQALTYNISTRLVLDGGCYVAARGDLPRVTFFAGVTYSVADLYQYLHRLRH